jgi:T-box protein 20
MVLNSMHRFQPRVHLVMRNLDHPNNNPVTNLEEEQYHTYIFPETVFTAVTAYQNQLVSLKLSRHQMTFGFEVSRNLEKRET